MNAAYKKYVDEIREVMSGRRGWVSATVGRAKQCECSHAALVMVARATGLEVARNGRRGWIAFIPNVTGGTA